MPKESVSLKLRCHLNTWLFRLHGGFSASLWSLKCVGELYSCDVEEWTDATTALPATI